MAKTKHVDAPRPFEGEPVLKQEAEPVRGAADEKTAAVRRWAVEQAITLHGQHGATTDKVLVEAGTILAFVNTVDKVPGPTPPIRGVNEMSMDEAWNLARTKESP